ncbi:MAG: DUF1592 domain-containing protein [Mariniblastus sp.]|nr:DUF1592 domain-containing protein [Mariniblastus sp.]
MKSIRHSLRLSLAVVCWSGIGLWAANGFAEDQWVKQVQPLIESSCLACHSDASESGLDLSTLGHDLSDPVVFKNWEHVFDRVQIGEMPPADETRPEAAILDAALAALESSLRNASQNHQQEFGRVPTRRLTPLEFEYSLHDLFGIHGSFAKYLPPENRSSSFDTVARQQGMSAVHLQGFLKAADVAMDEAIQLGPRPNLEPVEMKYQTNPYTTMWFERPIRNGGQTVKLADGAWVSFDGKPHVAQSNNMGYRPKSPGLYRITAEAYGYQADTVVSFQIYKGSDQQGGSELIGSFDLPPGETRQIELTHFFTPADFFYPAPADHDCQADGREIYRARGAKNYRGEGLAIKWLKIQGPLEASWPPASTRTFLQTQEFEEKRSSKGFRYFNPKYLKSDSDQARDIISNLGHQLFRRPLQGGELDGLIGLAVSELEAGRPLHEAIQVPLKTMISSPQFLYHAGAPGRLKGYALATRLSYFLWKSIPDKELFELAATGMLQDKKVLEKQVNRMLDDKRSNRFIDDFLNQWLGLGQIDATTPDDKLFPEYDDNLRQAMLGETRAFFRELIDKNLSTDHLIDSDFTFLNRRLAEHYGMLAEGEEMVKVSLAKNSVRGGLMTQASILKVTANGAVTSPVKRGDFVLDKLLGTPPSPPPPNIGSIEPDTRGTTTIRETLAAHRDVASCASCHRTIDPPGFALEQFDPIGGYRTRYRSTGKGERTKRQFRGRAIDEYREGPEVDAAGVTETGVAFNGIREYKQILMDQRSLVAKNLLTQLVVYSTGAEIQFADRDKIHKMTEDNCNESSGVRDMIHAMVQSDLFLNK